MSNTACGGRGGSTDKKICISSNLQYCGTHGSAGAGVSVGAELDQKGQLFIGVPNVGDLQKAEVYVGLVMLSVGLDSRLQSMMTDKASVATWEGVFEASSGEVLTDVADLTDQLRRGADALHMGLTTKNKPRFSPLGEGILESKLVRLTMFLKGQSEDAMSMLEDC